MKKILSSLKAASFIVYLMRQISVCELQLTQVSPKSGGCLCPGDVVTFECNVVREGSSTVWRGSGFHCPNAGNEITLLHSRSEGNSKSCNGGAIFGRRVQVENDSYSFNYTSQLDVTLTSDLVNTWIECVHDNSLSESIVGSLTITTGPFSPLNNLYISLANFTSREFTFRWSPVSPDCHNLHYNILASNCGSCPTTTTNTAVTCTDVPTDCSMCTFAVESSVCGNIVGNSSDVVRVITILQNATDKADVHSNITTTLTKLTDTLTHASMCTVSPVLHSVDIENVTNLNENQLNDMSGNRLFVSTIALAIALVVCVTVFTAVVIVQMKEKVKIRLQLDIANGVSSKKTRKELSKFPIEINQNVAYATVRSLR